MQITRASEYGLLGVLYLARQYDGKVSMISEIAEDQDIPPRFLAKIFQALAKAGVLRSHRGVRGGFSLKRPPSAITMKDVIEAIEGPIRLSRDHGGLAHAIWMGAQQEMTDVLSRSTFADLAKADRRGQWTDIEMPVHFRAHRSERANSHATPMAPELLLPASPALSAG